MYQQQQQYQRPPQYAPSTQVSIHSVPSHNSQYRGQGQGQVFARLQGPPAPPGPNQRQNKNKWWDISPFLGGVQILVLISRLVTSIVLSSFAKDRRNLVVALYEFTDTKSDSDRATKLAYVFVDNRKFHWRGGGRDKAYPNFDDPVVLVDMDEVNSDYDAYALHVVLILLLVGHMVMTFVLLFVGVTHSMSKSVCVAWMGSAVLDVMLFTLTCLFVYLSIWPLFLNIFTLLLVISLANLIQGDEPKRALPGGPPPTPTPSQQQQMRVYRGPTPTSSQRSLPPGQQQQQQYRPQQYSPYNSNINMSQNRPPPPRGNPNQLAPNYRPGPPPPYPKPQGPPPPGPPQNIVPNGSPPQNIANPQGPPPPPQNMANGSPPPAQNTVPPPTQ